MIWAKQDHGWGMGNFIQNTPAIRYLSKRYDQKIPVYFEEPYISDLVLDCPFMEVVKKEPFLSPPTIRTKWTNVQKPDHQYLFERVGGVGPAPAPYVDVLENPLLLYSPYVVFIRGALFGNESQKDPEEDIYFKIAEVLDKMNLKIIYLGVERDHARWSESFMTSFYNELGPLRRKLAILNGAEWVISNDTGLYHVAGALKKKGFILWKNTPFVKNMSPNENFTYSRSNWFKEFSQWVEKV